MPCLSLHGARIAWSCEGLAVDPLLDLLSTFPPAHLSDGEAPRVELRLRSATAATAADPGAEGFVPSFFHGIVQAYRAPSGFLLFDRVSRILVPLDGSAALAEIAPPDCEITPGSTSLMLHIALTLALRRLGLYHLHAAGLVHPGGPRVLVAGDSGAGKTTTTLALIEAGFDYLGDDSLFIQARTGPLEVFSFPREFHLGEATLHAFPRLAPLTRSHRAANGRRTLDPRQAFPGRQRARMAAPDVLLLPRVGTGGRTEMEGLSQADGLGQLIACSATLIIDGLPGRDDNLALLRTLVHGARIASLTLGPDMLAAPSATLTSLLSDLIGATAP
jgi:hypothetical protein